jgi:hypothetical protein
VKLLPKIELCPQALEDIDELLRFVTRQPWGRPDERRTEIYAAFDRICLAPLARPVCKWVRGGRLGIRCYDVKQFVVAYAYIEPGHRYPGGCVRIRGVGHRRERDVLLGVTENAVVSGSAPLRTSEREQGHHT